MEFTQTQLMGMVQSGLNLITQAISIHDQDLRLVHANRRFQTLFQLPDRLVRTGSEFGAVVHYLAKNGEYGPLEDIDGFVGEKIELARQFKPHYFERTRANGTSISVDGSPLDEGGWISVYTDITDVKRQEAFIRSHAESLSDELVRRSEDLAKSNRELKATIRALEVTKHELSESRERLALINRMTPAHIAHVDQDGVYTHSNGRLTSILPQTDARIVGRKMSEVLGPDIWAHVSTLFQTAIKGESDVSEFRDAHSGRFIRLALTPDIDPDGKFAGAFILSTDVTEEVSARNALAHARRRELAAQLTSAMTHDFSNLLTIIMGQQAQIDQLAHSDPTLKEISATIKSAARRGADLINNLNRISPQRTVTPTAVTLVSFLNEFTPLARAALPETMTLDIEISVPDERLIFDPGYAQDALLNLLINASEACSATGKIVLSVSKSRDGQLEFLVSDNGPGFIEDALHNALNPFYSTKTKDGGRVERGLGLTSAYDFAKCCGGVLKLANGAIGAEVRLLIPYQTPAPNPEGLVLLVDDDDDVRKSIRNFLRRRGHAVIEAASVDEASKLLSVEGLSHIVTDLDMGSGGSGLDVVALAPSDIPVLIVTGLPQTDAMRKEAEKSQMVLNKPFDFDALATAMDQLVS